MASPPTKAQNFNKGANPASQETMLIQDGYCSPERSSNNIYSKQTPPKSILKESVNSGIKQKKGIVINETLNETRKLSLKSETSDNNAEVVSNSELRRPQSAGTSTFGRYGVQASGSSQKSYEDKRDQNERSPGTSSKISSQEGLSDFQKAYLRKLQRENEQQLYLEMMRKSNPSELREGQPISKEEQERLRLKMEYEKNKGLLRSLNSQGTNLEQKDTNRSLETISNLDHIEEKIYQLEKSLDAYTNKLRSNILKRHNQTRLLENDTAIQRENGEEKRSSSVSKTTSKEKGEAKDIQKHRKNKNSVDGTLNNKYKGSEPLADLNTLKSELDQLREENQYLKTKLSTKDPSDLKSLKQEKNSYEKAVFEKELELLKTIECMREKLYNSVSKKLVEERKNENTMTRTFDESRTKKSKAVVSKLASNIKKGELSKYEKVRKAYGAETLERENACSLYEGLSTSYNGFHWNADQSLKIPRKI